MIELPILDGAPPEGGRPRSERPEPHFWRSPAHREGDPAFLETQRGEFAPGADEKPGGASRRQFLQLMGASMALAGLTACRRPVEKILPYARKPEEVIPGIPLYYATGMPFRGTLRGLLVESHEGRPTKVEGNPQHPSSQGRTSLFEQGSILNLYDPDRLRTVRYDGNESSWDAFTAFAQDFGGSGGNLAVLCEETSSPTVAAVRQRLGAQYPNLRWITYSAEGENPVPVGMQQATGRPLRPFYHFDQADVIVALDADFLGSTDRNFIHNTRSFAEGRRLEETGGTMSRLYAIESTYSLTGGMADHRLRLRASDVPQFAQALAARLGTGSVGNNNPFAEHPYAVEIARDLQEAGSRSIVLAGETQPPEVHALAMAINSALGSIGGAVELLNTNEGPQPRQARALRQLTADMRNGAVDALVIIGCNPAYSAPAELGFADALEGLSQSIYVGLHLDETARLCRWAVPRAHYLEAWGDGRAYDGTLTIIQPLIAPLYDEAHSEIEVLNVLATGNDAAGYDLVRSTWRDLLEGDFEGLWRRVLHEGFLPETQYAAVSPSVSAPRTSNLPVLAPEAMEIVYHLDSTLLDGAFANNAWHQELPDPTTKIVWDNVAVMSQQTADDLDVSVEYSEGHFYADVVELVVGGQRRALPVWIVPGHPDNSISVTFGYGREITSLRPERDAPFWDSDSYTDVYGEGAIATGVGVNVAPMRSALMERVAAQNVQVTKTGETQEVVTTQEHGTMEGRALFRMGTLDEYREDPHFVEEAEAHPPTSETWEDYPMLWQENHPSDDASFKDNPYYRNQWGMTIDLQTCTGCEACVMACNSENNIQVVGKEQVSLGREMHWLRLDRYFVSEAVEQEDVMEDYSQDDEARALRYDSPNMVLQPVLCMHCENAPCESVCPVYATVHSPDGLNAMVYNRCIGTRYCSNNCPYKVRRYNWYNWTKTLPLEVQMAQNPYVTMRYRGVMEKCSFCMQRIRRAQRRVQIEGRPLDDGEVLTACQQVCPANAIEFGDLNDPESRVAESKENPRRYEMLAELNVKPRLSYLGRVRNLNPRLDGVQA